MKDRAAYGTPYTLEEVRQVLQGHRMDPYHRALMWWLVKEVGRQREVAGELLGQVGKWMTECARRDGVDVTDLMRDFESQARKLVHGTEAHP